MLTRKGTRGKAREGLTGLLREVSRNRHAAYVGKSRTAGLSYGLPYDTCSPNI